MNKGDQTREHIVSQAAAIFNQRGFEGTSMSDLMAATGLQKGGLYRHFKNKEELAVAAFEHSCRLAAQDRFLNLDEHANAVDQLKQFIDNFVNKRGKLVPGGCPILNTAIDADDGNAALREQVKKALGRWTQRLRTIVEEGHRKGELRKDVDPEAIVTVVISALEGGLMMGRLTRSDRPLQQIRTHLNSFLDGCATK
jgi:TetR/AcrR family transcriptional repressor of nem operon